MNMVRAAKIERKVEYLPYEGEVKATNDAQGIIEGYLNYCSNVDFGDDRTMPGAFKRTIADSYARKSAQSLDFLWPYLFDHNYNILPPGGIFEANEDKNGLYIKTRLNLDTQLGREIYASFKAGFLRKQSMGYRAIKYEYIKEDGRTIRNLLEVAVVEGSCVIFPMNDLATVDTVKAGGRRIFTMPETKPAKKDFAATYQQSQQSDWLSDLYLPWYALYSEIISAFQIGDQPVEDVRAALAQFSDAMLAYVQQGVDLGMVEELQPNEDDTSPSYISDYMSDDPEHEHKAGRVISARNHALMTKAIQGIQGHCNEMKSMLTAAQQQGYANASRDAQSALPNTKVDAGLSTQLDAMLAELQLTNLTKTLRKG